jgi:hypothetical protein
MDESENGTLGVRNDQARLLLEAQVETARWQEERAYFRWHTGFPRVLGCGKPGTYFSILFIFAPLGIIAGALAWNPRIVFAFNILAIPPLARMLASTVTKLSARLSPCVGGVLKAIFGNAILLTVGV